VARAFRAALPLSSRGTAEPLIACTVAGSAEFEEREAGDAWLRYSVRRGDLFVTRSKTPYELRWNSPSGAELEVLHIHLSVDQLTTALEAIYGDRAADVEVTEFFGRDETLTHFCFACGELLSSGTVVSAKRIAAFTHLLAIHIAEKYTNVASQRPDYRGGLPIARLRKIEDFVPTLSVNQFVLGHREHKGSIVPSFVNLGPHGCRGRQSKVQ
jgi:AraC family transcriptional regulator